MPDLDATQFLGHADRLTALVDLESYVIAPPALDLVNLELIIGPAEAAIVKAAYTRHRPLPDIACKSQHAEPRGESSLGRRERPEFLADSSELQAVCATFGVTPQRVKQVQAKPTKPMWRITTPQGAWLIKRMPVRQEQLAFTLSAWAYLAQNGVRLPALYRTPDGQACAEATSGRYLMMEAVTGTKVSYARHLPLLMRSLAQFHLASHGFIPPPDAETRSILGRWPAFYQQKRDELRLFKEQARHAPADAFSRLFLPQVDDFLDQCEQAISRVADPRYQAWVAQVESVKNLCHQDYTAGNVLLLPSGALCIFDLDAVAYDLPARDLRKILNKVMKKRGLWDGRLFQAMMAAYTAESPLTTDQLWVTWMDLQFPHLFCELASKYYNDRCDPDWTAQKKVKKLQAIMQTERSKASILEPLLQ
jgi:CotS family spore coat protein